MLGTTDRIRHLWHDSNCKCHCFPSNFYLKNKQIKVRSQDHYVKGWELLTGLDIYGMTTTGNVIFSLPLHSFIYKKYLKSRSKDHCRKGWTLLREFNIYGMT
jgi:hypothetical protein